MKQVDNQINLDSAVGAVETASKSAEKMRNSSKKTTWRFARAILAVNLLALPGGEIQSQSNSPTNNSPTNSVHRDVFYNNPEFRDANSREDCDRILQEVLKDIDDEWKAIKTAAEAAWKCNRTYRDELETNDLNHRLHMAQAANRADDIFWECMGISAAVGAATGSWAVKAVRAGTVTVVRVVSGAAGILVGYATYKACKELRSDTAQDEVDAANNIKKNADELALRKRDRCREDTNYERAVRRYRLWKGSGGSGGPRRPSNYRRGNYENLKSQARADYYKCLALFPSGDCGTTE